MSVLTLDLPPGRSVSTDLQEKSHWVLWCECDQANGCDVMFDLYSLLVLKMMKMILFQIAATNIHLTCTVTDLMKHSM